MQRLNISIGPNQDTERFLIRHQQDFSVVLSEVRMKVHQVSPTGRCDD
jgi:hypothetical protein